MSQKRTNIAAGLTSAGITLSAAMTETELAEAMRIIQVGGGTLSKAADSALGTPDEFVLAPKASQTNTITLRAVVPGPGTGIVTVAIADASDDNLAVTNTAGVISILLANTTDSKNTLTLIKAAIDAANTSTVGNTHAVYCYITGTASTQMVHGGTNTETAVAAGTATTHGIKASTAGAYAARLSYVPSA